MSANSLSVPFPIFNDIDGDPLDAGYIYIGTANLDPVTNPISVYFDAALTVPAAQPIRTLNGFPSNSGTPARLYVNATDYSITVKNKNGSQVYTSPVSTDRIPVSAITGQLPSSQVDFLQSGTGASTRTGQSKLRDNVSVKDFGAVGDGTTDDTAAIQAAIDFVYNSAVDTGTSYSLTLVIPQLAWNGTVGKVYFPTGKYKVNSKITLKTGVHLYGDNAMLFMTAGYLELSNIWTGLHNLNLVTDGTTTTAIIVEDTEATRRNDVPIVELDAIKFKNFADCFKCGASIVNGFSMMKFRDLHTENCTQFSSKLYSDRAEFTSCSFRVPFDTTDIAFIYNNSAVSFEGCTFVPWPEVTSGTNIQNARYVDNYGTFVSFHNCRLGNEDLNAGNNAVTTYRAAENVSAVYNYKGVPALANSGADYWESAAVSIISLTNNLLFHRNSSAIVLFDVPNKIVIKGNVGTSGAIFDANLDVQTADYLIRVDSGITYPSQFELRRLISIDVDQPSSFMHLFDIGSDFSNPLFECVRLDGVTRLYQPDSVSGTTATFTLDVSHLPAAHTGRIKVYGQPRSGSDAVAILDFEYSSRMYYDTTGLTDNKQVAAKTPLHTIRADEGGSIVHNSPNISSFVWGGSGSPTTTWLDRDDLRLVVTNMGVSGDKNSCYAVLEAYPTNGVLYL